MDAVVKVDKNLLKEIEELVKNNRFLYANKKQVVNLALLEFLKLHSFKKESKQKRKRGKNNG
tara:strand:+ start:887 stop:1072 length:186 start_codon:yes stop_codon:yes gene_type:complete